MDKTAQLIWVRTTGDTLGTTTYRLDLDLYGHFTNRTWSEVDGIATEQYTLEPVYESTSTSDFNWVVTNTVATIT